MAERRKWQERRNIERRKNIPVITENSVLFCKNLGKSIFLKACYTCHQRCSVYEILINQQGNGDG